jgi:integrase
MSRKFIKLSARREHDSRFVVAVPKAFTYTKRERRVFTNQHEAEAYANNVIYRGYIQAEAIRSNGENKKLSTGSLGQWIEKYLIELHVQGSMTSWRTKRHTLGRLGETFGHRPINSITRDDMLVWIQSIKGVPYTKLNHQSHARSFFRWCIEDVDDPPIDRNPIRRKDRIRIEHKNPTLFTPELFAACLQWTKDHGELELLAHLCLGGFHGIRSEELFQMNWEDLDWKINKVHVLNAKRVHNWRPRHLDMRDGVQTCAYARQKGLIFSGAEGADNWSDAIHQRLARHRKPMLKAVGLSKWPRNTLRHSFKSYDEALHENFSHTQREMGHSSPAMTRYGYGADTAGGFYVTKEMAQQWFAV